MMGGKLLKVEPSTIHDNILYNILLTKERKYQRIFNLLKTTEGARFYVMRTGIKKQIKK